MRNRRFHSGGLGLHSRRRHNLHLAGSSSRSTNTDVVDKTLRCQRHFQVSPTDLKERNLAKPSIPVKQIAYFAQRNIQDTTCCALGVNKPQCSRHASAETIPHELRLRRSRAAGWLAIPFTDTALTDRRELSFEPDGCVLRFLHIRPACLVMKVEIQCVDPPLCLESRFSLSGRCRAFRKRAG